MVRFCKLRQHITNWIRFLKEETISRPLLVKSILTLNASGHFSPSNKSKPIPEKVIHNNLICFDDRAHAEAFNAFFKSVFHEHSGCKVNLEEPTTLLTVNCSLCYVQVTVEEISKIFSSLDVYKALRLDNLPT